LYTAPPHILKNVSVTPSTVFALVSWDLEKDGDGGYPISNFQIAYRLKNATENDWKICIPAYIDPKKVRERKFGVFWVELGDFESKRYFSGIAEVILYLSVASEFLVLV